LRCVRVTVDALGRLCLTAEMSVSITHWQLIDRGVQAHQIAAVVTSCEV
jgi:hypothetical protein